MPPALQRISTGSLWASFDGDLRLSSFGDDSTDHVTIVRAANVADLVKLILQRQPHLISLALEVPGTWEYLQRFPGSYPPPAAAAVSKRAGEIDLEVFSCAHNRPHGEYDPPCSSCERQQSTPSPVAPPPIPDPPTDLAKAHRLLEGRVRTLAPIVEKLDREVFNATGLRERLGSVSVTVSRDSAALGMLHEQVQKILALGLPPPACACDREAWLRVLDAAPPLVDLRERVMSLEQQTTDSRVKALEAAMATVVRSLSERLTVTHEWVRETVAADLRTHATAMHLRITTAAAELERKVERKLARSPSWLRRALRSALEAAAKEPKRP